MAKSSPKSAGASKASDLTGLELALKIINLTCDAPETLVFTASKKGTGCIVGASNTGSEASCKVSAVIAGLKPGESIGLPAALLNSALRGLKTAELKLTDKALSIKSGAYTAELFASEVETTPSVDIPEGDGVQEVKMSPALQEVLSNRLPLLKIEKAHQALPDAQLSIRMSAKERYLAVYDSLQVCYVREKVPKDGDPIDLDLDIPYTRFASFIKDLPVANCSLYITQETLTAVAPMFRVRMVLPIIDPESLESPETIYSGVKEAARAEPLASIELDQESFKTFIENSRDLIASGTSVSFVPKGKATKVEIESVRGKTSLSLPGVSIPNPFSIDNRYMTTLLSKQPTKKSEDSAPVIAFDLIMDGAAFRCSGLVNYVANVSADAEASEE